MYAKVRTFDKTNPRLRDLTLATLFAVLTALGAQLAVRLPFSPVPITFQVVMVIGPVFAGGTGGPAVIFGPTGGYLLAFPVAAFAAGWLRERAKPGSWLGWLTASLVAVALIYAAGASWLAVWLRASSVPSMQAALAGAWRLGIAPFILTDLAKAILVVATVKGAHTKLIQWVGMDNLDHQSE